MCVRFIINLPPKELDNFARIGTHVEEAHWFYTDFVRPLDPTLPHMNLRIFSLQILKHCPFFAHAGPDVHHRAYEHWIGYKKRIPVRGAILLNEALDSVVLVKPWGKGSSWMFPRGKVNQHEDDLDCAVREVWEETGFNVKEAGLMPANRLVASHELTMKEQHIKLFFIPNVTMDTRFETRTRKEISKIQWYKITDLPGRSRKKQSQAQAQAQESNGNKFFMVAPFIDPLNRWVKQQLKRRDRLRNSQRTGHVSQAEIEEVLTEEEGTATETAPERLVFESVESREAQSRELHRLLHIQPAPERSQVGTTSGTAAQDKGKALLAMLQQNRNTPPQPLPTGHDGVRLSHTSMNHAFNDAPQPHNPHYHQSSHIPPPGVYEAQLPFPIQPDINSQMRSFLGIGSNSAEQALPQQTQMRAPQQPSMPSMPASQAYPPNLVHPQPLPPQANHILTDASVPTPQNVGTKHQQPQQQANVAIPSATGMALPQQLVASLGQRPVALDDARLVLLNAFKKGSSPQRESVTAITSSQISAPDRRPSQQQQGLTPEILGSPYSSQRKQLPVQHNSQSAMLSLAATPRLDVPQPGFKPSHISPMQQRALLDIFKKPSAMSPRSENARPDMKENGIPPTSGERLTGARFHTEVSAGVQQHSLLPRMEELSTQANSGQTIPHSAQTTTMLPNSGEHKIPQPQQFSANSGAQFMNSLMTGVSGAQSGMNTTGNPASIPQNVHVGGSPYSVPAQVHMSAPAANSNAFPNLVPRRQEANPQQLQKLMSLFNKSTMAVPPNPIANIGLGPTSSEQAFYSKGPISTPASRTDAVGITPGLDGALSMSRRSSQQAPISPENEKFLLNYLKTVSDSAK